MRNHRFRTIGAGLFAGLFLTAGVADACRCVPRKPAALAAAADAIVMADVAAIDDRDPTGRLYRLRVLDSWKTRLSGPLIVTSEATSCRAELTPGTRYLVYLKRAGRGYSTDACSGNRPATQAAAIRSRLGKPLAAR